MIRFSRREDYAVILVTSLAKTFGKRLVSLSEIAKEYNISLLFLRNVANDLRAYGLVRGVEGKNGGYTLEKNPQTLKMGEVLKAFSTEPLLQCCTQFSKKSHSDKGSHCPQEGFCRAGYIWRKLNKEFLDRVSNLTIEQFINYK